MLLDQAGGQWMSDMMHSFTGVPELGNPGYIEVPRSHPERIPLWGPFVRLFMPNVTAWHWARAGLELAMAVPIVRGGAAAMSAAEETMTLYHGTIDNFSRIAAEGLEASRTPTWVTTDLAAAENAIGPGRVLSAGQGLNTGIITSVVPRAQFEALQGSGAISGLRTWPGFGGGQTFGEYVLRRPNAIQLFNEGIRF
jgi:hypothetical protein